MGPPLPPGMRPGTRPTNNNRQQVLRRLTKQKQPAKSPRMTHKQAYKQGNQTTKKTPSKAAIWLNATTLGTQVTLESKEKVTQIVDGILKGLTGGSSKDTAALLKALGRGKSAVGFAKTIAEIAVEAQKPQPNKRIIGAKLLSAVADGFGSLPTNTQDRIMRQVSRMMSKAKSLRPLARLMSAIHRAGAAPEALKVVASIIEGNGGEFTKNLKDLGNKLKSASPKTMVKTAMALVMLLPRRARTRALVKIGLRKFTGVGSVIAGVADTAEITRGVYKGIRTGKWRTMWRGFAGLGCTVASLVPFGGPIMSGMGEFAILAEDISHNASKLSKQLQPDK